jgi:hypothetical protein
MTDEPETDRVPEDRRCPRCGAPILMGYGLCGGGIGVYWFCETDACDWFFKRQDREAKL